MTIRKILLSGVAIATLSTASFAATADANLTSGPVTFNTVYTSNLTGDVDYNATKLNYVSGADLLNSNIVTITLDPGAKFKGDAGDWHLYETTDNNDTATGISLSDDGRELILRMSEDVSANTAFWVGSTLDTTDKNTTLLLDAAATTTITATFEGKDNINDVVLTDAAATTTLFNPVSYKLSSTIKCGDADGTTIVIDSDDKTKFDAASGATTATTAKCTLDIAQQTQYATIDFDYTDVNITTTIAGGNFADGNFTVSTLGSEGITSINPAPVNNIQTFVMNDNLNTSDLNATFTYNLTPNNVLNAETFPIETSVSFPSSNGNASYSLTDNSDDKMVWDLSTYRLTVLNMRDNPANLTNTYIKLYNKDTTTDATVDVQVTLADGSRNVNLPAVKTVPAGGAVTLSSKDVKAAFLNQEGVKLTNGYSIVVSYEEVDKKDGDATATQTNDLGDRMSSYNIRIEHNRPSPYQSATDGYSGL